MEIIANICVHDQIWYFLIISIVDLIAWSCPCPIICSVNPDHDDHDDFAMMTLLNPDDDNDYNDTDMIALTSTT